MNQRTKKILITPIVILLLFVLLFFTSEWWCPSMWGSHSLGNNLYAMDWDGNTQIVVYRDKENLKGRTCYNGSNVIPSSDSTYQVRVEDIEFNKEWVIVKAEQVKDKKECYFVIHKKFNIEGLDWQKNNCDSILQSHITGPLSLIEFKSKINKLNIELTF
jgi:hypothetical protein